jgi:hypothetical protein
MTGLRAAVIACLLCLAGCSGTTFVYNRLDTILPWYVDDYVQLSSPQEQQLDSSLRPFLRWHRQQELPRYVGILDEIDASLARPVTSREIGAIYSGVEVAWLRLEEQALDWLLELGATLSDAQVQEFLDYLWDKQQEYEAEYLTRTGPEYLEESYESFADSIGDYLGRLTPQQRERLEEACGDLERSDAIWLQERAAWLERLAVVLQRQPGWQQQVRDMLARRSETLSPRYQQVYEHNLEVILGAVADVLNSRTDKQDRHLRQKLAGLREDLQTLIAQGETAPADAG